MSYPLSLLIVLLVVMLLFGGAKVPQMARSLGTAKKEFEAGRAESTSLDERKA